MYNIFEISEGDRKLSGKILKDGTGDKSKYFL